ncbi:MAG TPA: PKD domain-containing protein, partial [Candidatus Thermoplasmatota archaeon]
MRIRLASIVLAIAILLPGCLSDPGEPADVSESTAAATTTTTAPVENVTNNPPIANISADIANGSFPLLVNFTINVTDQDGDNLTWSLDADADGVQDAIGNQTNLSANFTYLLAGIYNATLNVTD